MSHNYLIYKHTSPSGKSYIGQTNNYDRRNRAHQNLKSGCRFFRNAIQKYGWDNFTHEIIADNLSHDEANKLEEQYIEEYNTLVPNGYNLTTGGNSRLLSDETKQLLSEIAKQNMTEEKKNSIRQVRTGVPRSDKTKEKLKTANKGKVLSEEHKQKTSNTMKGRPAHNKGKPISDELKQRLSIINKGRKRHIDPVTGKRYYTYPDKI